MGLVEDIKERLDIVDVIGSYVSLRRSGKNYKALCPFHEEKTPSFVVFPETQSWHCFGACSTGGDLFSFVMKKEGVDFQGALQLLATRAGLSLEAYAPENDENARLRERLRKLHAAATAHFQKNLQHASAEMARAYIEQRGLQPETIALFQLGYALNEWEDTLVYLQGLGFSVEEMELAGLVVRREDGRVYDRFRGRLIIPIHDAQGRVVAFAGRVLDGGQPKYLNSPQTPIFDKGRTLYGYAQAVHAIRQEDRAVIVEGYMDVLSAHQAGYRNVVASMGTALTASHMRLLARHTQHIVLALDADAAGQKAALRGVEVAREGLERGARLTLTPIGALRYEATLEVDLRILQLPEGMDPDDLIRQAPERWKTLVEQALPVVDFYLQHFQETLDLDSAEGKAEMVRQMRPLLREIRSETVRYHYVQKLARMLRVDERLLATEVLGEVGARRRRPARRSSVGRREGSAPPPRPNVGTAQEMERHLMTMLLRNPEHLIWLGDDLKRLGQAEFSLEEFSDSRHRLILQGLLTGLIGGNLTETREILPELPEEVQEYTERLLEQARALPEVPEQVMRQKLVTALIWWRLLLNKEAAHQLRFLLEELPDDDEHVLMTYSIRLGNHLRAIYELERLLPALTMTH